MSRLPRRRVLVASLLVLTLGLAGAAYALWNEAGSGTGTAATGTTIDVTLSPGTPTAGLYPGGQSDVELSVSNPNEFTVHIGSLALDTAQGTGGFAVDAGHSGCNVAALSFSSQTNGGDGWTIPAKVGAVNGSLPIALTNALTLSTSAVNACQGASATVYLDAGP